MKEEPNSDLTRMVPTSDIVSVWSEGNNNQGAGDQVFQGLGQARKTKSR